MSEKTYIDDLVILGRAHPEPMSSGRRHTVCVGGYSESIGYVRLYPTRMGMDELTRWNVVSVEVTESDTDHRAESYKIAGSKTEWDHLFRKVEKVDELSKVEQIRLTEKLSGDCRADLNQQRVSLGMVKPNHVHSINIKDTGETPTQVDLSGRKLVGKNDFPHKLYIEYECEGCNQKTPHNQHVIEWGVYEFWKKHKNPEAVIDALRLNDDSYSNYFFIGNLHHQPTAYIIISVLRFNESDMSKAGVRPRGQASLSGFDDQ